MSLTIIVRFQVAPFSVVFVRSTRNDVIANILLSSLIAPFYLPRYLRFIE